jgi:hypothetical protein
MTKITGTADGDHQLIQKIKLGLNCLPNYYR